jgi:hypothetical protein
VHQLRCKVRCRDYRLGDGREAPKTFATATRKLMQADATRTACVLLESILFERIMRSVQKAPDNYLITLIR